MQAPFSQTIENKPDENQGPNYYEMINEVKTGDTKNENQREFLMKYYEKIPEEKTKESYQKSAVLWILKPIIPYHINSINILETCNIKRNNH